MRERTRPSGVVVVKKGWTYAAPLLGCCHWRPAAFACSADAQIGARAAAATVATAAGVPLPRTGQVASGHPGKHFHLFFCNCQDILIVITVFTSFTFLLHSS